MEGLDPGLGVFGWLFDGPAFAFWDDRTRGRDGVSARSVLGYVCEGAERVEVERGTGEEGSREGAYGGCHGDVLMVGIVGSVRCCLGGKTECGAVDVQLRKSQQSTLQVRDD